MNMLLTYLFLQSFAGIIKKVGKKGNLPARFIHHVNLIHAKSFTKTTILTIFTRMLDIHFQNKGFISQIQSLSKVKFIMISTDQAMNREITEPHESEVVILFVSYWDILTPNWKLNPLFYDLNIFFDILEWFLRDRRSNKAFTRWWRDWFLNTLFFLHSFYILDVKISFICSALLYFYSKDLLPSKLVNSHQVIENNMKLRDLFWHFSDPFYRPKGDSASTEFIPSTRIQRYVNISKNLFLFFSLFILFVSLSKGENGRVLKQQWRTVG